MVYIEDLNFKKTKIIIDCQLNLSYDTVRALGSRFKVNTPYPWWRSIANSNNANKVHDNANHIRTTILNDVNGLRFSGCKNG